MTPAPRARPRYFVDIAITSDGVRTRYDSLATEFQIVRGVGDYVFFNQAPDVGQMIMKSRNKNLDPILNPSIRANSTIEVYATTRNKSESFPIFTGKVTNVEVDYQPNDKPDIKVNAIDALGELAEHSFTPEFAARPDVYATELTLKDVCELIVHDMPDLNIEYIFNNFDSDASHLGAELVAEAVLQKPAAKTYIRAGDNAYDVIAKLAQADLMEMVCDAENKIWIQPYFRFNPLYWHYAGIISQRAEWFINPQEWQIFAVARPDFPTHTFTEDKTHEFPYLDRIGGSSFTDIAATDGYGRTINSIVFNNTSIYWDAGQQQYNEDTREWGPYEDAASIAQYGQKRIVIDTARNDDNNLDQYYSLIAQQILEESANPVPTVNRIKTNTLLDDFYEDYSIRDWFDPMKARESAAIFRFTRTNNNYVTWYNYANIFDTKEISKTMTGVYFLVDPDDPSTAIDKDYEIVGVTHYITPESWETEFTFSIESKETQLIKNLAVKRVKSVQSRVHQTEYNNRVMEWDCLEDVVDDGSKRGVYQPHLDDNVDYWWWVFGPNATEDPIHWQGPHKDQYGNVTGYAWTNGNNEGIQPYYNPTTPQVSYWGNPGSYYPGTFAAINGVGVGEVKEWDGTGLKRPLCVFRDINGWYYLHATGKFTVSNP